MVYNNKCERTVFIVDDDMHDRIARKSLIRSALCQFTEVLQVFLLAYLLFAFTCLQRFHHVVFICLHVAHFHWSLIFVASVLVPLEAHNFELILKIVLKVRIFVGFTCFTFFNNSSADFPYHLDQNITNSNPFMIVADQPMNKGMFSIILFWSISSICCD